MHFSRPSYLNLFNCSFSNFVISYSFVFFPFLCSTYLCYFFSPGPALGGSTTEWQWATISYSNWFCFIFRHLWIMNCTLLPFSHFANANILLCFLLKFLPSRNVCLQRFTVYSTPLPPNHLHQPYWLAPRYWELVNSYTLLHINPVLGLSAFFPDVLDILITKDLVTAVYMTTCSARRSDHVPVLVDTRCRSSFLNTPDSPELMRTDWSKVQAYLEAGLLSNDCLCVYRLLYKLTSFTHHSSLWKLYLQISMVGRWSVLPNSHTHLSSHEGWRGSGWNDFSCTIQCMSTKRFRLRATLSWLNTRTTRPS